ncbi:hypothetical protein N7488_005733 [Penicillium malachiteum]|nr:hypothetical protein N7488_005733 [Penicillium malachiteum]
MVDMNYSVSPPCSWSGPGRHTLQLVLHVVLDVVLDVVLHVSHDYPLLHAPTASCFCFDTSMSVLTNIHFNLRLPLWSLMP